MGSGRMSRSAPDRLKTSCHRFWYTSGAKSLETGLLGGDEHRRRPIQIQDSAPDPRRTPSSPHSSPLVPSPTSTTTKSCAKNDQPNHVQTHATFKSAQPPIPSICTGSLKRFLIRPNSATVFSLRFSLGRDTRSSSQILSPAVDTVGHPRDRVNPQPSRSSFS